MKKKKSPLYKAEGGVTYLAPQGTDPNFKFRPKRKGKGEATTKDYISDIGRFAASEALAPLGLDSLIKDKYKTELGAKADDIAEKYINPIERAGIGLAINTVAPGAGGLYTKATGALSAKLDSKQMERKPGETEQEYAQRMAAIGIDIYDQSNGLQGSEDAIGSGIQQLAGIAGFAKGGNVSVSKAKEILRDGTVHGKELTGKQKRFFGWKAGGGKAEGGPIKPVYLKDSEGKESPNPYYFNYDEKNKTYSPNENYTELLTSKGITDKGIHYGKTQLSASELSELGYRTTKDNVLQNPAGGMYKFQQAIPVTTGQGISGLNDVYNPEMRGKEWQTTEDAAQIDRAVYNKRNKPATPEERKAINAKRGYGKAEGGDIIGPGTAKSDSIMAKVPNDSFVVPEENSGIASMLRDKYLGNSNKKADLSVGNGIAVALSNGEHLFTPEEKSKLRKSGVNVNALAPNAEEKNRLKENGVNVDALAPNAEDNQALAEGGNAGNNGPDERAYKKLEIGRLQRHYDAIKNMPDRKAEAQKTLDRITSINASLGNVKPEPKKSISTKKPVTATSTRPGEFKPPVIDPNNPEEQDVVVPESNVQEIPTEKTQDTQEGKKASQVYSPTGDPNLDAYNRDKAIAEQDAQQNKQTSKFKITPESALAGTQIGMGIYSLFKDGARPQGSIDVDFNKAVNRAVSDASYGFDAATKEQYRKDIEAGRISANTIAANMAGSNAGLAQAYSGAASNSASDNLVKLASADASLRMQKQQYADQLVSQRAGMQQQLFENKLRAFEMNQAAGANLLGAGIQNFFGNRWREQNLKAQQDANNTGNIDYSSVINTMSSFAKNPNNGSNSSMF